MANKQFIERFEKIRNILRQIYIYGSFTRDDFIAGNISGRKYDNEIRRIVSFLKSCEAEEVIVENKAGKRKTYAMNYNMFSMSFNYLTDYYAIKNFTMSSAQIFIKTLQILSRSAARDVSLAPLQLFLEIQNSADDDNSGLSEKKVYRELRQMQEAGFLNVKKNRSHEYSLMTNLLGKYSPDELKRLHVASCYYANVLYPSTAGYFFMQTLSSMIKAKSQGYNADDNVFIFKHNRFQHAIDDEIFWQLLCAMQEKSIISFIYESPQADDSGKLAPVIPVKLVIDEKYGRRYLFAVFEKDYEKKIFRLDKISMVEIIEQRKRLDYKLLDQIYKDEMKLSWNGNSLQLPNAVHVEILFRLHGLTDLQKDLVLRRIKREGKWGVLQQTDCDYVYSVDVTDPLAMKPWIRSFGAVAQVQPSTEHDLAMQLSEEIAVWSKMYADIQ